MSGTASADRSALAEVLITMLLVVAFPSLSEAQQLLFASVMVLCVQEKVLAQVEKEGKKPKAAKPKAIAKDTTKTAEKAETATKANKVAEEEEEEAEEDPVTTALNKYGIITENPWEKGVK